METIKLTVIGIVLGALTLIPGVSTGTLAIVFNVYDRLIGVITPNIKKIFAAWKFWLPLAAGIFASLFISSKLIVWLLDNYPVPVYWFLIGVIVGSLPMVYRRTQKPASIMPSLTSLICCVLAFAVMVLMFILNPSEEMAVYTVITPVLFGLLVLGGILSAIAMIIPGISGAFILIVIGLYRTVLQAVSDLNIMLIIPIAIGTIAGLLGGAALVRFLLKKAPRQTYGAVLGLVAGSIIVLYPGGFGSGYTIVFSIAGLLAGGVISFFISYHKKAG